MKNFGQRVTGDLEGLDVDLHSGYAPPRAIVITVGRRRVS